MKILFIFQFEESLGIEYLSSILKREGHQTYLIYFKSFKHFSLNQVFKKISQIKPDIVAFSVFTHRYQESCTIAKYIKEKFNLKIVFGGIHPTLLPRKVIKKDYIDFVIIGEGEYAFLELVNCLSFNNDLSKVPNLYYKKKGRIFQNKKYKFIEDLNTIPFPDKELFYNESPEFKKEYSILTGKGCPFDCSFCCNTFLKKAYKKKYVRRRTPENVIQELEYAKNKFNMERVWFVDENFTTNHKWLKKFLSLYKRRINIQFKCSSSPENLTEEIVRLLKSSGCYKIKIGIETFNERLKEDLLKRKEKNDIILDSIRLLNKYKIYSIVDYIFGIPGEKKEDYIYSAYYLNQAKPTLIKIFWLKYFPNTLIIDICKKRGLVDLQEIKEGEDGVNMDYLDINDNLKKFKKLSDYANLFVVIPILPKKVIEFILNYKIYLFFPKSKKFFFILKKLVNIQIFFKMNNIHLKTFLSYKEFKSQWKFTFR